jgi:RNA polymerase sigma-70 factor (ECF subfamily)
MGAAGDGSLSEAFRALSRGNMPSLEVVWRGWSGPLHSYAYALTGNQDDADDILGDVMVNLARQRWRLRLVRNPKAYLFAAVRNAVASRARRPRAARTQELAEVAAADETEDDVAVRAAVLDLPAEQREVVALHIWGGLTFAEIGRVIGISQNTAASRYRYALEKLRKALGDERDGAEQARVQTQAREA